MSASFGNQLRLAGEATRYVASRVFRQPRIVPDLARLAVGNPLDLPPVIIGGCGRSGTSVVVSLLSALPSVLAIPHETHTFTQTLYSEDPDPDAPFEPWRLACAIAVQGIPESARRWCEKTPKNVIVFGRLLSYFDGDVRLIHIVRDGRDVVTSKHKGGGSGYYVEPERWVKDVSAGLRFRDHESVYSLRYEDLVQNTSTIFATLGEFLDEDLSSLERTWVEEADVQSFGPHDRQVARPLDGGSIGRWKNPEHEDRVDELMQYPEARRLLSELGYES